jgi:hypothetical protein
VQPVQRAQRPRCHSNRRTAQRVHRSSQQAERRSCQALARSRRQQKAAAPEVARSRLRQQQRHIRPRPTPAGAAAAPWPPSQRTAGATREEGARFSALQNRAVGALGPYCVLRFLVLALV